MGKTEGNGREEKREERGRGVSRREGRTYYSLEKLSALPRITQMLSGTTKF